MTTRALLIEIDDALGHWLCAVLAEAKLEVEWVREVPAARAALGTPGAQFALCVVEGVIGGQGVELAGEASRAGCKSILLIPRGGAVMTGVADRILEHPLTRTGLLEALEALGVVASSTPPPEPPPPPQALPPPRAGMDDDQQRMMAAAEDRIRLGLAALQEGNFEAAVIELDAAGVLAPHDLRPKLHGKWARYARVRASVREAIQLSGELAKLTDFAPSADAHYYAAATAHDFGDPRAAAIEVGKALHLDPEHALARQLAEIVNGEG